MPKKTATKAWKKLAEIRTNINLKVCFTSKAILPAFPFVLHAQKKQFICIFLMKSIAKSMLYQKELLYLAKMKTGLNLVCMLKHHHLMLLSWNLFRFMFTPACTKLILVYLAPTILHQYYMNYVAKLSFYEFSNQQNHPVCWAIQAW